MADVVWPLCFSGQAVRLCGRACLACIRYWVQCQTQNSNKNKKKSKDVSYYKNCLSEAVWRVLSYSKMQSCEIFFCYLHRLLSLSEYRKISLATTVIFCTFMCFYTNIYINIYIKTYIHIYVCVCACFE